MAAPMVAGVAALMAGVNPRLSAAELRALLLQNATSSNLQVAAGYVDALRSVLAAASAVGYDTTQRPQLKVLQASDQGRAHDESRSRCNGSATAIRRYAFSLDGKRVARLAARSSPFKVTLAKRGKRVRVQALDASGRSLASAQRKVSALTSGKSGSSSGGRVGA